MKIDVGRYKRLDEYLSRLQAGASLEDVSRDARATGDEELLTLLAVAASVRNEAADLVPEEAFVRTAKTRIFRRITSRQVDLPRNAVQRGLFPPQSRWVRVGIAACLALALLFSAFGVVDASAAALPGDGLYPLKRALERVQLGLTLDAGADEDLLQEQAQERLSELEQLAALGRYDDVPAAVDGYLQGLDAWQAARQVQGLDEQGGADNAANIAVLQGVLEQAPAPAQAAIQRALDRILNQGDHGAPQGGPHAPESEPEEQRDQHEQEQLSRQAEQIAEKYAVSVEDVLAVYHERCNENWGCVRTHYRTAGGE